jgi:hypothetical protein
MIYKGKNKQKITYGSKSKKTTFTKEDVARKIWKYRYLPPDPRTGFFERNTKEETKFREIPIVPEFTRTTYVEPSVDLGKKKVKPQIKHLIPVL